MSFPQISAVLRLGGVNQFRTSHTLESCAVAESRVGVRLHDHPGNEDLAVHGRIHNMDLVRRDTNQRTCIVLEVRS